MGYKNPEQQRKYQLEWITNRRKAWLDVNGPCSKCGSNIGLQIDHIDRANKVNHRLWSWSAKRREAELAKCQVLCEKCHTEKTRIENTKELVHGTFVGYTTKGCRCPLCKKANTKKQRMWLVGEKWSDKKDRVFET